MAEQSTGTRIIIENNTSNASGVASFIFGLISIFVLAPIFVPLAMLLGIIAIINKQISWGILGLLCAFIGFATSPILLGVFAASILASQSTHTNTPFQPQYQQTQQYSSQIPPSFSERMKQVMQEVKAAIEECRNKRLTGEYKTYVASANCSNPKIIDAYQNVNYPYMDLIGQLTAKRLEVSEKIDVGKITEGEGQLEAAKFVTQLNDIESKRNAAR